MTLPIKGDKLLRLNYIVAAQSDALQLATKLKLRYQTADVITVSDPGGLTFHYTPAIDSVTQPILRIPKKTVEEFNIQLLDGLAAGDLTPDLDSLSILKAQLDFWIDTVMAIEAIEFGENDIVDIISLAGSKEKGKIVYSLAVDGFLDSTISPRQKRVIVNRVPVLTIISDDVAVNSLSRNGIIDAILLAANNPAVLPPQGADPAYIMHSARRLFAEDIKLPYTHFVDGQAYVAQVDTFSLDYYGTINFKIALQPLPPAPIIVEG